MCVHLRAGCHGFPGSHPCNNHDCCTDQMTVEPLVVIDTVGCNCFEVKEEVGCFESCLAGIVSFDLFAWDCGYA